MIKNRFEKRSLKRSELYDETLDIEEVWKPKKRPKEEIETKTNSKYFVNAKIEKITPKVPATCKTSLRKLQKKVNLRFSFFLFTAIY